MRVFSKVAFAASALFCIGFLSAPASAKTAKECDAEYAANKPAIQGAKEKKKDFITACRAGTETIPGGAAAAPVSAPAAAPAPTPVSAPASTPRPAPKTTAAAPAAPATLAPAGNAIFPTAVSSKYSTLSAGKARMQTCLDQYNANKANNGNGGLKWIQKGGGYYSQCNTRLKG